MSKLKKEKNSTSKVSKPKSDKNKLNKDIKLEDLKNISLGGSKKALKQKEMNFLERYEIIVENKPPKVNPKMFVIPAAGAVGVLVAVIVCVSMLLAITNNSNKNIEEYINSSDNIAKFSQAEKLKEEIANRNQSKKGLDDVLSQINKYPNLDKDLVDTIFGIAAQKKIAITMVTYKSDQGYLSIECKTAEDVNNISKFAKALNESKKFAAVSYDGYSGDSEKGYCSTISIIRKGN